MENLFKVDGTGLSTINKGIEDKINLFVDGLVSEYGRTYNNAELELYTVESVINRFGHNRLLKYVDRDKGIEVKNVNYS